MRSFFVWYRLAADPAVARATVAHLQRAVLERTGIRARIYARGDEPQPTWMEVYEGVSDARRFEAALEAIVAETGAEAIADGGRHTERFDELPAG